MKNVKKLLITADDYGMCESVDEAIYNLASNGFLTTTNVLVNLDTKTNIHKLKMLDNISIGIHWNITTGNPITNPKLIPTIVKENGEFFSLVELKKRILQNKVKQRDVELELENQLKVFIAEYGDIPTYWNTHENSGLIPFIYRICSRIALKNRILCTRNFQRVYLDFKLVRNIKTRIRERLVKILMDVWFGLFAKKKFIIPSARMITFYNQNKCDIDLLTESLEKTKKETIEIVIHPATEENNIYFGNIGSDRKKEYDFYSSETIQRLWKNYELINYSYLINNRK